VAFVIDAVEPRSGLTTGNELVSLRGTFPASIDVWFGDRRATIESRVPDASTGMEIVQVRTPGQIASIVDVSVLELDASGAVFVGSRATLPAAFRFTRVSLGVESDLTRLIRTLLRELKRQVLQNTSIAVSVEYPEDPDALIAKIAEAKLPSLVLSGPRLRENRDYSTNELGEEVVVGLSGPELRRLRPPLTMDLELGVTIASDRAAEMLNLQSALIRFVRANRWLVMPRDAAVPDGPIVGWELDPVGELRPLVEGTDRTDLRAFAWGIVIRGFDLAEDQVLDVGRQVERAGDVSIEPLGA
jgi:hypothetical protein